MKQRLQFSDDSDKIVVSPEIPKEERHLRTQPYDKSVEDMVTMIRDGELIINPEYQRNYVWNNKKASLLVESILLNVPLPVFYVAEEEDGKWSVIDGLQRLNSLLRYYNNEFKLTGLEVLQDLNGYTYTKLNPKARRILGNGSLRTILIFKESHPEIKYDIFIRLNRGSIQLSEQELRNCLFRGTFNDLLKKLVYNKNFLKILRLKAPHKRMRDIELILRYFAVSEKYNENKKKLVGYKGSMRTFLNDYMYEKKTIKVEEINEFQDKFNSTIEKVFSVFGEMAFRKINKDGIYDKNINRAVADLIMISFEKFNIEELITKKGDIVSLLKKLPIEDTEFYNAITFGTSDTVRFGYRLARWFSALRKII